jgi:membrane protease YdiL (CAAX protease family)
MVKKKYSYKRVLLFSVLSIFLSWLSLFIFFSFFGELSSLISIPLLFSYSFMPGLVAIFLKKVIYKEPIKKAFGINFRINKWFVFGWLYSVFYILLTIGSSKFFPDTIFNSSMPLWHILTALFFALLVGVTINAILDFLEEMGWRGFLFKELEPLGFFKIVIATGVIWGCWRIPLVYYGVDYPNINPILAVFFNLIITTLISFGMTYFRIKSKSVVCSAIMRGTITSMSGFCYSLFLVGNPLVLGATKFAGFISLVILALVIIIFDRFIAKEKIIFNLK